ATMETGSPRKIQFTVPLLDTHLDPEAAEQIRRRRPTPATLVASSDQSSPEPVLPILPTLLLSLTFYLLFLPLFQSCSSWWNTICTGSNREQRMSAPQRAACPTAPVPTRFRPGRSSHMMTKPP
ncbi:unnamed protein product, partial [Tetraodon nigroviridis]